MLLFLKKVVTLLPKICNFFNKRVRFFMKIILNSDQIKDIIADLTNRIISEISPEFEIAVIGIRSRGEILAQRLSSNLAEKLGKEIENGTLDITLYRDDLNSPQGSKQPHVRTTEIGFNIDDKILRLACAWHDISYTLYKASPRQYFLEARRSVRVIKKYFKQAGFMEDELKIIIDMVLYHDVLMSFRYRNGKRNLYNKIIQDADFLDGVHSERVGKVKEMAKSSLYWKFVNKVLIPLFLGGVIKNKNKFLNLEESKGI